MSYRLQDVSPFISICRNVSLFSFSVCLLFKGIKYCLSNLIVRYKCSRSGQSESPRCHFIHYSFLFLPTNNCNTINLMSEILSFIYLLLWLDMFIFHCFWKKIICTSSCSGCISLHTNAQQLGVFCLCFSSYSMVLNIV